jgi:hypothetical protein
MIEDWSFWMAIFVAACLTTGTSLGFYFGRCDEYPSYNNHVFGGNFGWLTGDVTHWAYVPTYPAGYEYHAEKNAEYARSLKA